MSSLVIPEATASESRDFVTARAELRLFWDQNITLSNVVCRANKAFLFHLLNQAGRLIIPYGKLSLDVAGRAFAILQNDGHGLIIEHIFALRYSG